MNYYLILAIMVFVMLSLINVIHKNERMKCY